MGDAGSNRAEQRAEALTSLAAKKNTCANDITDTEQTKKTITKDGIAIDGDSLRIQSEAKRTVHLFEIPNAGLEDCMVMYRARIKSNLIEGQAYLEMWCHFPDVGEFFSKGLQNPVQGTTDWASYEIPFFLKKGQRVDLVRLNVVIEGRGSLWLKDIEVMKVPALNPDLFAARDGLPTAERAAGWTTPMQRFSPPDRPCTNASFIALPADVPFSTSFEASCAVPVFPQTSMPGSRARIPVPS